MAASDIEWTDKVWNPVRGCSLVSQGCKNCYAMRQAHRFSGKGQPYEGLTVLNATGPTWTGKVVCDESKLEDPLHWKKPRMVFVNSMSDLFHGDVPESFILACFTTMSLAQQHKFQILTKRPERMLEIIGRWKRDGLTLREGCGCVLPNVWLGVSVEDRKTWLERSEILKLVPATVRFLSYEPALADLGEIYLSGISWVICGGESGPGARPMHPDWARSARDQCVAAGVPFFFKQWGNWMPVFHGINPAKNDPRCRIHDGFTFPKKDGEEIGQHMWNVGKRAAGRLLDGREWSEYPKPTDN